MSRDSWSGYGSDTCDFVTSFRWHTCKSQQSVKQNSNIFLIVHGKESDVIIIMHLPCKL